MQIKTLNNPTLLNKSRPCAGFFNGDLQGHYYLLVGTDLSGRNQPGGVGDLLGGYYTEQGELGLLNLERAMQLDLTIAPH